MVNNLIEILKDKKVLILGFGKEGISSYRFLIKYIPAHQISIADQNEGLLETLNLDIDKRCTLILGIHILTIWMTMIWLLNHLEFRKKH